MNRRVRNFDSMKPSLSHFPFGEAGVHKHKARLLN